jgi:cation diffusion facilitator family transporter
VSAEADKVRSPAIRGGQASIAGIAVNVALAVVKVTTGLVGNSYALVADGIESAADVVSSLVVWSGLRISIRPPDEEHPYGHGKAESVAAFVVAIALLGAAGTIAYQSIQEIRTPHSMPAWFTLPVLLLVIAVKALLFRFVLRTAEDLESTSLKGDAWHHYSDAITSAAAAIGIIIALVGGEKYAAADDWAALLACGVIAWNGIALVRAAADELMDRAAPETIFQAIRETAAEVEGVLDTDKCFVRKYGMGYVVDLHVVVDGQLTVEAGHAIGHRVKDALCNGPLKIIDVLIHIEPGERKHSRIRSPTA